MQAQLAKDSATPCSCHGESTHAAAAPAEATLARVQVSPHQDAAIRIRLIPGRDVSLPDPDPCGFGHTRPGLSHLPAELIDKLKASDKQVTAWLAKSGDNARLFFTDPVTALAKAGVQLERGELKAISRAHASASADAVMMPGVRLSEVAISATDRRPSGKPRVDTGRKPASGAPGCCAKEG